MTQTKKQILKQNPELELTSFGDFKIKEDYVKKYEIIDFHCHLFSGLDELFPKLLKKEKQDMTTSFFDKSCFPLSNALFDLDKICFTRYPKSLMSLSGLKARVKLITGAFVLNNATPKRLIRDMKMNHIEKSLVLQISPRNKNSSMNMELITKKHPEIITFGSIHPLDKAIDKNIENYLKLNIKGWKLNPHVAKYDINAKETIDLVKKLSKTNLPIISCSGSAVGDDVLKTRIFSKRQKLEQELQRISYFEDVLKAIPNSTFIFAHAGLYENDELIELMLRHPNTYTDISTQPSKNIRKLIDKIGSERLLFGTDYPFFNQAFSIVSVLRATEDEEERKNIFARNAKRILCL